MPDDVVETQEQETSVDTADTDFDAGFGEEATDEVKPTQEEEVTEEATESTEEVVEEKDEAAEGKAKGGEADADKGGAAEEEEADEDIRRGREMLKAEEDRTKAAETARQEKAAREDAARRSASIGSTANFLKPTQATIDGVLARYADPTLLSGKVMLNGTEVDMGDYVKDNPEIPVVAGLVAHNFLQDLVDSGVLPSGRALQAAIVEVRQEMSDRFFEATLKGLVRDGDPEEIIGTPEFKDWSQKAPREIKILFKSDDPRDHARALNRFLADTGKTRDAKKEEVHNRGRAKRDAHNKLFGADGGKSRASGYRESVGKGGSTPGAEEEEFDAGFNM